jgi:hypothetical protein
MTDSPRAKVSRPSYGTPSDATRRWCKACSAAHPGAIMHSKGERRCQDCKKKVPLYGMPVVPGGARNEGDGAILQDHLLPLHSDSSYE